MERIIHGHYADPDSTRDIIGITPHQFEILIMILQQFHVSTQEMLTATEEERADLFKRMATSKIGRNMGQDERGLDMMIRDMENDLINSYNVSYEFLAGINQPYPGASYNS